MGLWRYSLISRLLKLNIFNIQSMDCHKFIYLYTHKQYSTSTWDLIRDIIYKVWENYGANNVKPERIDKVWCHYNNNKNFIVKIYIIWYNENNSEMKTDSVTAKDRHVINSSPLVLSTNVESCMKQFLLKSATNCMRHVAVLPQWNPALRFDGKHKLMK